MRYPLLDALRGFSLCSMAGFHLTWDLIHLCGAVDPRGYETALYLWQQSICWTFIFLSGFSWPLGRRPARRGLEVFFCGAVISAASVIAMPAGPILFGILTFLGSAMILLAPLAPILFRIPAAAGLALCVALFALCRGVNRGVLGFPPFFTLAPLPGEWYRDLFTAWLGFPPPDFISLDYFSLLPWLLLYGAGFFFHRLATERGFLSFFARSAPRLLALAGRHSLAFYLLHQPVLIALLLLPDALSSLLS